MTMKEQNYMNKTAKNDQSSSLLLKLSEFLYIHRGYIHTTLSKVYFFGQSGSFSRLFHDNVTKNYRIGPNIKRPRL